MKQFFISLFLFPAVVNAKLQIATTTTDLAALVRKVGHDQVEVFSIAKGTQDPHQIEAKPSFMVKLRSTDLVIAQGLELESAWILPLIQGARNPKLNAKNSLFEVGAELEPIEIQSGASTRAEGDVHPGGNPHFQMDPLRLGKAAVLIALRMSELDPSQKDFFQKNALQFQAEMTEKYKAWQTRIKKTGISEIATYHKTFSYFCDRFGIRCEIQLEPKPGIPPTAGHLLSVVQQLKSKKLRLILIENLYEDSVGDKIKNEITNILVKRVPVSVEGEPSISTNEQLIEQLVQVFEAAAK